MPSLTRSETPSTKAGGGPGRPAPRANDGGSTARREPPREAPAPVTAGRLELSREQILPFRRRVGALDEHLSPGADSLRVAAWAGLQDSMPRAALLSIHARVEEMGFDALGHASLAQVWGPRFSLFVVAERDVPIFTLGRYPTDTRGRGVADAAAARLRE